MMLQLHDFRDRCARLVGPAEEYLATGCSIRANLVGKWNLDNTGETDLVRFVGKSGQDVAHRSYCALANLHGRTKGNILVLGMEYRDMGKP